MKQIPHYTKVLTLGSSYTENALVGDVIVQEKIDGSQMRWGINEDEELLFASKGANLVPYFDNGEMMNVQKLFVPAVKYLLSQKDVLSNLKRDTYFFGETLMKPKHNVLKYERVPTNNIVLFDVLCQGKWASRQELETWACILNIDVIPELYVGKVERKRVDLGAGGYKSSAIDFMKRMIETTPSYLGNEKVEGVVIKNYAQTILLGGNVFPLFTKYVRESFKEKHDAEWKIKRPKDAIVDFVQGFKSEARWQKAIIHLKEKGELEQNPRDIGKLIKTVQQDIIEEEQENIKNYLYKKFIDDIKRVSIKGLPEWYKQKLMENLK